MSQRSYLTSFTAPLFLFCLKLTEVDEEGVWGDGIWNYLVSLVSQYLIKSQSYAI